MGITHAGELAAIVTAVSWTVSSTLFDQISKRVGTFAVNYTKVCLALIFISIYLFFNGNGTIPSSIPANGWMWLSISGLIGFIIGDLFLFQAFIMIGARISMVVYAIAPSLTAVAGYFIFGESLPPLAIVGMAMTLSGIVLVVISRPSNNGYPVKGRAIGVFYAFLATICQAAGYLLSKQGMAFTDPVRATQIRLIASVAGFTVLMFVMRKFKHVLSAIKDRYVLPRLASASFFGPFFGVTLSMYAIHNASAGIVSTIISTTPVLLIVPAVFILKERVTFLEIAGALLAVVGSALFFF
jgi:drug/metabolite transporter (DMT)-like permease